MPQPSRDPYLDILSEALTSLATGNRDEADGFAERLAVDLPPLRKRQVFTRPVSVAVFRRDRFTCRYCGSSVVPSPVLRAASLLWPDQMPFHPNWRSDSTHPIHAARTATIDHVEPHSKGGGHEGIDNFATACWPCNTQKSDFTLDALGWTLRDAPDTEWDGLTGLYPSLWAAAASQASKTEVRYHSAWLTSFAASS